MKSEELLKHRFSIMGISSLWIMLFHSGIIMPQGFNIIREIGYGGVDMFFFLSGIGCYYSLCKDSDFVRFIKRRAIRVMPVYLIMLCIAIIVEFFWGGVEISLKSVLGNALGVQFLAYDGWTFHWYITALWITYFLAPFFKGVVDRLQGNHSFLLVLAVLVLFSVPFWYVSNIIMIATRIPVFFLGMYVGRLCKQGWTISNKTYAMSFMLMVLGFAVLVLVVKKYSDLLWDNGLYWYPFIMIAPTLCFFGAIVFEKIKGLSFIEIIGKNSFEVYLVHSELFFVLEHMGILGENVIRNNIFWLTASLLTIPFCVILKLIISLFMRSNYGIKISS